MKILVIMLYWYPYEGPLQPIYGAIFKELMSRGHEISIVSAFPHFRKGRKETWPEFRGRLFEIASWHGARLIRSFVLAPVFDQEARGLRHRALNFISFNISSILAAIFLGGKADLIFAPSSPPLTNGVCAWIVGKVKRCPMYYNVQDIYPDMAEKLGLIPYGKVITLLRRLEKTVYRLSSKIVVISESMKKNIVHKGVPIEKLTVIPNCIDTDFIRPLVRENHFAREWQLVNRFVVMYAGNIGIPHGAEVIVEAALLLRDVPDIIFCIVGRGEYRYELEKLALSHQLSNVTFVGPRPEKEVPFIWASADVSLVTNRAGLSEDSVPSKLLAIMASGRPVIAAVDKGSEAYRMIHGADCGLWVEPENAQQLVQAIQELRKDKELRIAMGKRGRDHILRYFKKEVIVDCYEELFAPS